MNSMTGYGAGKAALAEGREVFCEISSVNRKGLELAVSLPREWAALEGAVSELARAKLSRGAVRITVVLRQTEAGVSSGAWDAAAVKQSFEQLRVLAERLQVPFQPDAELLLRLAQGSGQGVAGPSAEDSAPAVKKAVAEALEQLLLQRKREGDALKRDLVGRLDILDRLRAEIAPLAPATVARYRDDLHGRLKQIGLAVDLNDERILREIALFADRSDIAEELTRLASHLEQFRKILGEDGPAGRKLDFLCQEIHREINTIGSKSQHLDITRRVLEAKNELERIREQVQNVE